jgi:hypothetical protein
MFVAKTVFIVVFALSAVSFSRPVFAKEPVTLNQNQQGVGTAGTEEEQQTKVTQHKLRFIDENGDGLNDLILDSDGDGIPDGRMCEGSGNGAGWGGFSRQGGGRVMVEGAGNRAFGRGYGNGFRQGRGRR